MHRFPRIKFYWFLVLCLVGLMGLATPAFLSAQPPHMQWEQLSPLQRGEIYLLRKKTAQALDTFRQLWHQEPHNHYAVRGIVRAYQVAGQLDESRTFFEKFIADNPDAAPAWYGLGYTFYLQKKYPQARDNLQHAVELDPRLALGWNALAATSSQLKEYDTALKQVKHAIELHPSELMFYRNLKMIYQLKGTPEAFKKEYRDHLQSGRTGPAKNYGMILAQGLRQKSFRAYSGGEKDAAIQHTQEMLQIYREINHIPGVVAAHFSLGLLYEETGDLDEAHRQYREVLKINPQHLQAREKIRQFEKKNN
jgi:tetratricopeptide (TPR) repeat protein